MRTLRDLLQTWETWSERSVNRRALANARTVEQRAVMLGALEKGTYVDPISVLQDMTELVALLSGWRWQVVQEAREVGSTWTQIGTAMGLSAERAKNEHAGRINRCEEASS